MCSFTTIYLCVAAALLLAVRSVAPAAAWSGINMFTEPFHLSSSSKYHGIYTDRLFRHLHRDVDLERFRVMEVDEGSSITLRELEDQLRYGKTLRRFLHLGSAEGDRPGFVVGFPVARELFSGHRVTFALLAAHPRINNFPLFTLHGSARVIDFEKNNIEELLRDVPPPLFHNIGAGDVLSIEEVYQEALGHPGL